MMALVQKVCIVLLAVHTAHAFLLPRASLPPSTTALEQQVLRATGTSSTPQFNLRYGELPPQEGEAERLNRQKRWEGVSSLRQGKANLGEIRECSRGGRWIK